MLTKAAFIEAFPEFKPVDTKYPGQIERALTEQAAFVSDTWRADRVNLVHGLRTAHALITQPCGQDVQQLDDDWMSSYSTRLAQLETGHAVTQGRLF